MNNSNYKSDYSPHENIPLTNLIICHQKERKKCDYKLIDDACAAVANFFVNGDLSSLAAALDSLSFFFEYQKIIRVPQSFQEFDLMNILMTISINELQQFNINLIAHSITALKYIFRSNQMCSAYLSEAIIASICGVINNWDKIFSFEVESRETELISIGDLIQILSSFLLYDHSFLFLVNSISPIQFLLNISLTLPYQNLYVLECFSSYFYSFFDIAEAQLLNEDLSASILFFNFCSLCYKDEFKPTYQYNLYSLSILIRKLAQNFSLDHFTHFELNQFVNSALLEDDNDIIFQAIRVLYYFHSPFDIKNLVESKPPNMDSSINNENEDTDDHFLHFPPEFFDIESLVVLPRHRDDVSDEVRTYSIIVLKTVFQYNYEHIVLFFKYKMPKFFISQFILKRFEMKKAICSLFLYIIEVISDDFIIELIEQGLFKMFIEFLQTGYLVFEILIGIKFILDRLQTSDKYPFFIVLLQEETFQNVLSDAKSSEDEKCAEIATILQEMTFIEDDE